MLKFKFLLSSHMEKLEQIIFYSIDKAIRTYRQYAQQELKKAGFSMTIDQWLVIKCILENPDISQQEIAEKVFKDNASITRIITLLVKEKYLTRKIKPSNRRRTNLHVTDYGHKTLEAIDQIVVKNRAVALNQISQEELKITKEVMEKIASNTKK